MNMDDVTEKLAAENSTTRPYPDPMGGAAVGSAAAGCMPSTATYAYSYTSARKLQIFHTILQQRHELTPAEAAAAAEAVFQKLCIPQAPTTPA
jgi:hypothetical protein